MPSLIDKSTAMSNHIPGTDLKTDLKTELKPDLKTGVSESK